MACACCHDDVDEPQGFFQYIEVSLIPLITDGKIFDITKGAHTLIINIYKNAKVQQISLTAAKQAFVLSVLVEGVHYTYDIHSAYVKMHEDILGAQEENREEQINRAKDKFKKTVVARSVSGVSAVIGATTGAFLGSFVSGGTFLDSTMGSLFGGILGSYVGLYVGARLGDAVSKAVTDGHVEDRQYAEDGLHAENGYYVEDRQYAEDGHVEDGQYAEDGHVEEGQYAEDGLHAENGYYVEDGQYAEDGHVEDGQYAEDGHVFR